MASLAALAPDFKPLLGLDEATVDEKGRILVGKKKRERLGETFVLAIAPTNCLVAYPETVWSAVVSEILSHEGINAGTEQYTRLMLGNAEDEIRFDAQGRFVVPQRLREVAKLKDKVVLLGCGNRMEIWAKSEYEEYSASPDDYALSRRQAMEKAYRQMKGA
jgi:MraZ protein